MAKLTGVTINVSGDILAHEVARFGLLEIMRRSRKDPFGFTGSDAEKIAAETIHAVRKLEAIDEL